MNNNLTKKLELLLRIAVCMTFFGHGMVALGGNGKWLPYLNTVGFSIETAKDMILVIGGLDLVIAAVILFKPYKYVVLWAVIWAFSTALIRPISGEPIWAFIERGSNFGAPLALYLLLKYRKK